MVVNLILSLNKSIQNEQENLIDYFLKISSSPTHNTHQRSPRRGNNQCKLYPGGQHSCSLLGRHDGLWYAPMDQWNGRLRESELKSELEGETKSENERERTLKQ
jgi:hypothetical protein